MSCRFSVLCCVLRQAQDDSELCPSILRPFDKSSGQAQLRTGLAQDDRELSVVSYQFSVEHTYFAFIESQELDLNFKVCQLGECCGSYWSVSHYFFVQNLKKT